MTRITFEDIIIAYQQGRKLTMLTAYDYAFAKLIDRCEIDMILVGDSLANVFLGKDSTREVDLETMLYHSRAVTRGVERALVIGDMPFGAYQTNPREAPDNARRFIEAGCQAVKVEWFDGCLDVTKKILAAGIPVMGHVGLTPQSVESPAGFKVQGKDADAAWNILKNARALADAGVFAVVLECIPDQLAGLITREIKVPTIGIGAGPQTSGQVLVIHDVLGLLDGFNPKFSKTFADAGCLITEGVKKYKDEVESGRFPDRAHSYVMPDEEYKKLSQS